MFSRVKAATKASNATMWFQTSFLEIGGPLGGGGRITRFCWAPKSG
jgi:hypothetical protein